MKDIRQNWKQLAVTKQIKSNDIAALCLYKSLHQENSDKALEYLNESFREITNPIKLSNGHDPKFALKCALRGIKYSSFANNLPQEELDQMVELSKLITKDI